MDVVSDILGSDDDDDVDYNRSGSACIGALFNSSGKEKQRVWSTSVPRKIVDAASAFEDKLCVRGVRDAILGEGAHLRRKGWAPLTVCTASEKQELQGNQFVDHEFLSLGEERWLVFIRVNKNMSWIPSVKERRRKNKRTALHEKVCDMILCTPLIFFCLCIFRHNIVHMLGPLFTTISIISRDLDTDAMTLGIIDSSVCSPDLLFFVCLPHFQIRGVYIYCLEHASSSVNECDLKQPFF